MSDKEPEPFTLVTVTNTMARHGVRYVLVGGVSGMLHGMTEYRTKDIDLLILDEAANRERLALAMNELSARPLRSSDQRRITGDDILISATGPNETFVVYADIELTYGQACASGVVGRPDPYEGSRRSAQGPLGVAGATAASRRCRSAPDDRLRPVRYLRH